VFPVVLPADFVQQALTVRVIKYMILPAITLAQAAW
jgi:hypothetical protein